MRPVGALIFGLLTDRYGRRIPADRQRHFLLRDRAVFAASAPNYGVFLLLRILYGIGMGGEWGVGASLVMEATSSRWRGMLSGILQNGYAIGYMLAALAYRFAFPAWGWRPMFWLGGIPALLALYISAKVPESEAWQQHRAPSTGAVLRDRGRAMEALRLPGLADDVHDVPLARHAGPVSGLPAIAAPRGRRPWLSDIVILGNIGALLGGIIFGEFSNAKGRRLSLIAALASVAGGNSAVGLWQLARRRWPLGAFLMQVGVQGAWGIIPAHLSELSADATRGLVPGLAYQMGIVLAARTPVVEYGLRDRVGYSWALAGFEIVTIVVLAVIVALGPERRGRSFIEPAPVEPAPMESTPVSA